MVFYRNTINVRTNGGDADIVAIATGDGAKDIFTGKNNFPVFFCTDIKATKGGCGVGVILGGAEQAAITGVAQRFDLC